MLAQGENSCIEHCLVAHLPKVMSGIKKTDPNGILCGSVEFLGRRTRT